MNQRPRHSVAVSAFVRHKGKVLLVKTHFRSDTWEIPGGIVEEGEPLHEAVCREVEEETGIIIKPVGITGVYFNKTLDLVSVVFYAEYISGDLSLQPAEIKEAMFVDLNAKNIDDYITRPHFKSRILDAMRGVYIPYEAWETKPFALLARLGQS